MALLRLPVIAYVSVVLNLADYTLRALICCLPLLPCSVAAFSLLGLLPASLCRQPWQLGNRRTEWMVGAILGAAMLATPTQDSHVLGWYAPLARDTVKIMPLWILVYMVFVSSLLWIAFLVVLRREQETAERDRGSHGRFEGSLPQSPCIRDRTTVELLGSEPIPDNAVAPRC